MGGKKKYVNLEEYKPIKATSTEIGKEKLLKEKISRATKAIRKKYLALKMGKADEDETLNRLLNPIIEPLKDIKMGIPINSVGEQKYIKTEVDKKDVKRDQQQQQKPPVEFLPDEVIGEVFSQADSEEHAEQTIDDIQEEYNNLLKHNKPVIDQFLEQFPTLSRYYIEGFFTNRENYDETFGARFDFQTNNLSMGNKTIHIGANNELVIGNRPYQGTRGLYELIFFKQPHGYTKNDLKNYKEILEYTSAHRRNYEPQGQIKGNRCQKYISIIKPLFTETKGRTQSQSSISSSNITSPSLVGSVRRQSQSSIPHNITSPSLAGPARRQSYYSPRNKPYSLPPREGSGMMVYNEKPIEYVYWDDVNELVDRLRLLMASKSAGNTDSHDNEILAIISELKEIGVLK